MRIEEGVYAYLWENAYENNCNTYVLKSDKTLLIDPGHSRHLGNVLSQMEDDGIDPGKIDLLLITHSHPDHLEGVEAAEWKTARVAMAREEEQYLQNNGRFLFEAMNQPLPRFRIDFYLREGELHLGKEVFEILHAPGHSPGSLCLYWPARKVLVTGDVIFYGGIGRTDFMDGNPRMLVRSIEKISGLDTETLLPGHGQILQGKDLVLQNFEWIRQNFYPYL